MWVSVPYEELKKRHSEAVEDVIKRVRTGRSKQKDTEPSTWNWGYSWAVQIDVIAGPDFLEMVGGRKPFPKNKELTDEQFIADYEKRAKIGVAAKIGRNSTTWYAEGHVEGLPKEIKDPLLTQRKKDREEKKRFDALTPEQQNEEIGGILRQLGRSPGFVALNVPIRQPKK